MTLEDGSVGTDRKWMKETASERRRCRRQRADLRERLIGGNADVDVDVDVDVNVNVNVGTKYCPVAA
jgi:hypothetical protein